MTSDSVSLFVTVYAAASPAAKDAAKDTPMDVESAAALVRRLPGLIEGLVYVPHPRPPALPFTNEPPAPDLALQLTFPSIGDLEAALSAASPLAGLSLAAGARIEHQAFQRFAFPVAGPGPRPDACTLLVTYPGTTADLDHWLRHYDANHPPIMVRFPGIRQVETYWPTAWRGALPWGRAEAMQRNKVVFDDSSDLERALASPVMAEMRADAQTFQPFAPKASHHPMLTRVVVPVR